MITLLKRITHTLWHHYTISKNTPITITTAGIIGPIPPEWHNQPKTT